MFPRRGLTRRVLARRAFYRRAFQRRALARQVLYRRVLPCRALIPRLRCTPASFVVFTTSIFKSRVGNTTFENLLHHNCPGRDTNLTGKCLDQYFLVPSRIVLLDPALPSFAVPWYAVNHRACFFFHSRLDVLSFCVVPFSLSHRIRLLVQSIPLLALWEAFVSFYLASFSVLTLCSP